jgi:hypothetical protein
MRSALSGLVPSERLAGTAGDTRIRGTAGAGEYPVGGLRDVVSGLSAAAGALCSMTARAAPNLFDPSWQDERAEAASAGVLDGLGYSR